MQSSLEMRLDMLEGMLEQANVERRKAEAEQEKFDRCKHNLRPFGRNGELWL